MTFAWRQIRLRVTVDDQALLGFGPHQASTASVSTEPHREEWSRLLAGAGALTLYETVYSECLGSAQAMSTSRSRTPGSGGHPEFVFPAGDLPMEFAFAIVRLTNGLMCRRGHAGAGRAYAPPRLEEREVQGPLHLACDGQGQGDGVRRARRERFTTACLASPNDFETMDDPYNLSRFVLAQEGDYELALSEIRSGRKRSHWMWYIFPQIDGLAFSSTSKHYAIKSLAEARAYLEHPLLGPRLLACAEAVVSLEGRSATEILGSTDDLKLRSCATLFACVLPPRSVCDRLLAKYYRGRRDGRTLQLLGIDTGTESGAS